MSGEVAISIKGIPNLSKFHVTISPFGVNSLSNFLALSSSRHNTSTPTGPPSVSKVPPVATSVVLWKPLVFDPSMTVFLMV